MMEVRGGRGSKRGGKGGVGWGHRWEIGGLGKWLEEGEGGARARWPKRLDGIACADHVTGTAPAGGTASCNAIDWNGPPRQNRYTSPVRVSEY